MIPALGGTESGRWLPALHQQPDMQLDPLDSQTRCKTVAREMRNKPCRCSHIHNLTASANYLPPAPGKRSRGRQNDEQNFPIHGSILSYCVSLSLLCFFFLSQSEQVASQKRKEKEKKKQSIKVKHGRSLD